jgi:hypothetical protein
MLTAGGHVAGRGHLRSRLTADGKSRTLQVTSTLLARAAICLDEQRA